MPKPFENEMPNPPRRSGRISRNLRVAVSLAVATLLAVGAAGCTAKHAWHSTEIGGTLPALSFDMVRARDGKVVTGADYRGKVVLLYFGYTYCPDACPTTLANISRALRLLGQKENAVRVLFVTVDPNRDTLPVLKQYEQAFAPQVDALRGDENAIAALARRYRIAYSVTPGKTPQAYEVTHSSAVYVFDQTGAPRLLISSLSTDKSDVDGTADDLRRIIDAPA